MALMKEPYGLVYNTDGTLCTTYRDDDIPFRGVRSFAVEEATENLVTNSPQQPPCFKYANASLTRTIVTSGNLAGWVKINVTQIGGYGWVGNFGLYNQSVNENRTYAIDAILPAKFHLAISGFPTIGRTLAKQSEYRYVTTWFNDKTETSNVGIYLGSTLPEGTTGSWDVYVRNYQIEQKPFASSFVVGSRPNGRLELENTSGEDMNNLVLTGWFKFHENRDRSTWGGIIEKATGPQGTNGFFLSISQIIRFSVDYTTSTVMTNLEPHKWYYMILIFDNGVNVARVYDGETIHEAAITKNVPVNDTNIKVGCRYLAGGTSNCLASNIFIGKYRKPNGEIIWTDDYIREVYEAKIPFPVSNKLSIY